MTEEPKCRDCKWLTGRKTIRGIECMNPKNQEKWNKAKTLWMGELRKDSARYKQGSALACKKFEAKESKSMGRYINADALIADMQERYCKSCKENGEDYNEVRCRACMVGDAIDDVDGFADNSIDIVRCQDCKYWVYNFNGCARNPCTEPWYATDFCNYGEREGE